MNTSNQPDKLPIADINDPDSIARQIFDRITILGIVDTYHLRDMPRNQRDRALRQLVDAGWIAPLLADGHLRAGRAGRPPSTYKLTNEGAVRVRDLGYDHAHAYGQTNAVNQAHDVCTLDIRLAAETAGLSVVTERVLDLAGDYTIRPDNALTMNDDQVVIFETEGAAGSSQRPRLLDKALSWNAAASALRKARVDLRVRVLINQKPGRDLDQTLEVWAQSLAVAQNTAGKPLDVRFWGRSLPKFLESPNWNSLDDFIRLDDPARVAGFGLSPAQEKVFDALFQTTDLLPTVLRRQSVAYERDRARLRAHARYFVRYLLPEIPPFSPDFFDLVREIRTVAFSDSKGSQEVTDILSIPIVALMMLRTYILHYPDLHQALFQSWRELNYAKGAMVTTRAAYRLIRTFLDFHGLRHDHPACQIRVSPPDLYGNGKSDFSVHVNLHLPCPTPETLRSQWRNFEEETEISLAWVLQQLLDYPEILEINHSPNNKSTQKRK